MARSFENPPPHFFVCSSPVHHDPMPMTGVEATRSKIETQVQEPPPQRTRRTTPRTGYESPTKSMEVDRHTVNPERGHSSAGFTTSLSY